MSDFSIIFDMDGTLSNTALATTRACEIVAEQMGLPPVGDAQVRKNIGYAFPELFFRLLPDQDEQTALAFGKRVAQLESEFIAGLGTGILFEGVAEMLDAVRRMDITMHIASTGTREHVHNTLEVSGIMRYFSSINSGQPAKVAMVGDIMREYSCDGWLMLGDKAKDAEAAAGNGIQAVGAAYGYCVPEEYPLFDVIIRRPMDLLEVV